MPRDSARVWHGMVRHVAASSDIALVWEEALIEGAACCAGEFNLEVCENHLRDGGVVAALRVVPKFGMLGAGYW